MISVTSTGSFDKTRKFFERALRGDMYRVLDKFGQEGVKALAGATPMDSGLTASSWGYRITRSKAGHGIEWYNTNTRTGANVAILIQYGHGTGTGGYVSGLDYINPVVQPLFTKIADEVWKEVKM